MSSEASTIDGVMVETLEITYLTRCNSANEKRISASYTVTEIQHLRDERQYVDIHPSDKTRLGIMEEIAACYMCNTCPAGTTIV